MKQLSYLIIAGVLGGLVVLGGSHLLTKNNQQDIEEKPFVRMATNNSVNLPSFDFTEAASRTLDGVVHIKAKESQEKAMQRRQQRRSPFSFFFDDDSFFFGEPRRRQGTGSGVILTKDGYIVTNNHVIEFADEVEVTLHDNRRFDAEIIGRDPQSDIAVLKVDANDLAPVSLGDSDEIKVGEWVLAVGNPFNLTSTVTAGIVSAKSRSLGVNRNQGAIESFIQTDAAVNPGNSGGALVDKDGNLVGINTAIASQTGSFAGYSFAIPVNIAIKIVDDIIQYGSYQRAYLGIGITNLDGDFANELGVNFTTGVVVMDVYDGGSAQYGGLLPNDIITKVDTHTIKNVPELQEIIGRYKVGETIEVYINRRGKEIVLPITLRSAS